LPAIIGRRIAARPGMFPGFGLTLPHFGEVSFRATGEMDFLGDDAFTQLSGAGGPNRTTRAYVFSLPLVA